MECTIQIQVKHALEGSIISVRDRLTTSERTDEMSQNVDCPEACDDGIHRLLRGLETGETRGQRGEIWMVEVGLLDVRGKPNDRRTRIQQGFRDVSSETTAGSGNESKFPCH